MSGQQLHLEDEKLIIGVSTSVIFDMSEADKVFAEQGTEAYIRHMTERADEPLKPAPAFEYFKEFHSQPNQEIVICSRNNPITAVRAMRTFAAEDFVPFRYMFTNGAPVAPYMNAYQIDQLISTNRNDVQAVTDQGIAATLFAHKDVSHVEMRDAIKAASNAAQGNEQPQNCTPAFNDAAKTHYIFDFDGVLAGFSAENFYLSEGLAAYQQREKELQNEPLEQGNLHGLFSKLLRMNSRAPDGMAPYKASIVTARGDYAAIRSVNTLAHWNLAINGEMHCISGGNKGNVFEVLRKSYDIPSIYFDDTEKHVDAARSKGIPAGQILRVSTPPTP